MVTNLILQTGSYAASGQTAMTLVDADSYWVDGYFAETQLPRIRIGDAARMVMMAYPDTAMAGTVVGIGRGISVADATPSVQGLPSVNPVFTWVRLAQRVPIRIALDDVPCPITLASGLTVTVSILDHGRAHRSARRPQGRRRRPHLRGDAHGAILGSVMAGQPGHHVP